MTSEKRQGRPPKPDSQEVLGFVRVNVNMPPDLKDRLVAEAFRRGTTMSDLILRAVRDSLPSGHSSPDGSASSD